MIYSKRRRIQYCMATSFLQKKLIYGLSIFISAFIVVLSFFYGVFLSKTKVVARFETFYLLVAEELRIEAGAEFIKLEGGAGYLLRYEGTDYLLMSVYLSETDGESVRVSLTGMGRAVQLLSVSVKYLYFKGEEKEQSTMYMSALDALKSYLCVMERCVSMLDNGATQESVKRILIPMRRQLLYLSNLYKTEYSPFAKLCSSIATELGEMENGILYTRDLRYLSCGIVDGYLRLCKKFTL